MLSKRKTALSEPEREDLASDPNTPHEELFKLASDPSKSVRSHLVSYQPKLSEIIQLTLAYDKSPEIRKLLAQRKDTTHNVLDELMLNDPTPEIEDAVLRNPNISMDILDKWFLRNKYGDSDFDWVSNPNTPQNVLRLLIEESHEERLIQKAIYHKHIDDYLLLDILKKTESPLIEDQISFKILTDPFSSMRDKNQVAEIILERGNTKLLNIAVGVIKKPEFYEQLANNPDVKIRKSLAKNPSTPDDVLLSLAEDTFEVAHSLTLNPGIKSKRDLINKLLAAFDKRDIWPALDAEDIVSSPWIPTEKAYEVIKENLTTNEIRYLFVNKIHDWDVIRRFAALKDPNIDRALALSYNTPTDVYNDLFNRDDQDVLYELSKRDRNTTDNLWALFRAANRVNKLLTNDIKSGIAKSSNVTPELLDALARDLKSGAGLWNVIRNPKTSKETLDYILNSGEKHLDPMCLSAFSQIKGLKPENYRTIYDNTGYGNLNVIVNLASNPSTPSDILDDILNRNVEQDLEESTGLSTSPLKGLNTQVLKALATNESLSTKNRDILYNKFKGLRIDEINSLKDQGKALPSMDYTTPRKPKQKINSDLELLKRLKGYIS